MVARIRRACDNAAWPSRRAPRAPRRAGCTSSATAPGGRPLGDVLAPRCRRRRHRAAARQGGDRRRAARRGRRVARRCATTRGALLILNDRPDLVAPAGADGVPRRPGRHGRRRRRARSSATDAHRRAVDALRPTQIDAARRRRLHRRRPGPRDADEAGPPAVGLELVRYAAAHAPRAVVRHRRDRRGERRRASSPPARGGSPSCARSPRPPTRGAAAARAARRRSSGGRPMGVA